MLEAAPLPPPPKASKLKENGRHAPATGRPDNDPHQNDDVQQEGKRRKRRKA